MLSSPVACLHQRNLLTYGSLLCGVGAIAAATHGSAPASGALIAIAVVADTFDGRFARLFGGDPLQRDFGAHLDSLSDALAFGLAPVVCTTVLTGPRSAAVDFEWWVAAFFYAASAITRLGFYHLPHASAGAFIGLPVPVAALIWATVLLWVPTVGVVAVVLAALAAAMIAPFRLSRPRGAWMAAFVSWPVLVGSAHAAALIR